MFQSKGTNVSVCFVVITDQGHVLVFFFCSPSYFTVRAERQRDIDVKNMGQDGAEVKVEVRTVALPHNWCVTHLPMTGNPGYARCFCDSTAPYATLERIYVSDVPLKTSPSVSRINRQVYRQHPLDV